MTIDRERKEIGKIKSVSFGFGGYQDAMVGLSVTLGGKAWGVGDFIGQWANDPSEHADWTAEERNLSLGKDVISLVKILEDAKVRKVSDLEGVPVEVTFNGQTLKDWRILTEVL